MACPGSDGVREFVHWCYSKFCFLYTEINRVRNELFHGVVKNEKVDGMFTELQLPTPSGSRVKLSEKVYAPVKEYPKVRLPADMHRSCMITSFNSWNKKNCLNPLRPDSAKWHKMLYQA